MAAAELTRSIPTYKTVQHVPAPGSVSDAIFTLRTTETVTMGGLGDIFAGVADGSLLDLPAMRSHQRPAVVTTLAVMMVALRRYAAGPLNSPADWAAEWHRQIGDDALRLVAPESEPAFMQSPTKDATKELAIEAVDCLLPGVQHEVKTTTDNVPDECWVLALMGGLARPNVNYNRPSTLVGLTAALPSMDGSLASEIASLVAAYEGLALKSRNSLVGTSAADHMVWLRPLTSAAAPLFAPDLPYPFLATGRAVRLYRSGAGLGARYAKSNQFRIEEPTQWLGDPHTPQLVGTEVERFRLAAKPWNFEVQHQILFGGTRGKQEVTRPRIMELVPYRTVRLCALGTDQGKTLGYREVVYSATKRVLRFGPVGPDDRAADLSRRMLDQLKTGEQQLRASLFRLLQIKDFQQLEHRAREKNLVGQATDCFRALAGTASVQKVFDLLQQDADLEAEQRQMNGLVVDAVWQAFERARPVSAVDYLTAAAAEDYLRAALTRHFQGINNMAEQERPRLVGQTYAVLQEMVEHLTPDDRARLRTMSLHEPPLSFWTVFGAAAPASQTDHDGCIAVWKCILRAMGRVGPGGPAVGRVLAETGFPEDRVSRLLVATGATLVGLIDEVARWLISHDVARAELSLLAALGLADALADTEAREWSRRHIALDYVRAARREKAEQTVETVAETGP